MPWYKVETKQPIYRIYHVEADSPEGAEQQLFTNLMMAKKQEHVDEWVGSENTTTEDTEEIDEEDANVHTIR
jgi:hypothetical protein|tara:strand:- start:456 stop:671 length:216 start_codon:yes stop_codon:yes gene_type:complete